MIEMKVLENEYAKQKKNGYDIFLLLVKKRQIQKILVFRDRQTGTVRELSFDEFLNEIKEQTKNKPFTGLNFPKHISKRPKFNGVMIL